MMWAIMEDMEGEESDEGFSAEPARVGTGLATTTVANRANEMKEIEGIGWV